MYGASVVVAFPGLAAWPSRNASDLIIACRAYGIGLVEHGSSTACGALDHDPHAGTFTLVDASGRTPLEGSQYVADTATEHPADLAMQRQRGFTPAAETVARELAVTLNLHFRT